VWILVGGRHNLDLEDGGLVPDLDLIAAVDFIADFPLVPTIEVMTPSAFWCYVEAVPGEIQESV